MLPQQGFTPRSSVQANSDARAIALAGAFLLRVARHERDGLSPGPAVLAATAEMGVDPAAVFQTSEEAR